MTVKVRSTSSVACITPLVEVIADDRGLQRCRRRMPPLEVELHVACAIRGHRDEVAARAQRNAAAVAVVRTQGKIGIIAADIDNQAGVGASAAPLPQHGGAPTANDHGVLSRLAVPLTRPTPRRGRPACHLPQTRPAARHPRLRPARPFGGDRAIHALQYGAVHALCGGSGHIGVGVRLRRCGCPGCRCSCVDRCPARH